MAGLDPAISHERQITGLFPDQAKDGDDEWRATDSHPLIVIPANAGIQLRLTVACKLDPGFRRGDE